MSHFSPHVKLSKRQISLTIFTIAMPVTLQNLAFYTQSFINTAFIGHYRVEGLSAINNAMIPFFMLFSFFNALSMGTTVLIAQAIGAKKRETAAQVAESSLFYNQIISLGYVVFWILFGPLVLDAMGARGIIAEMGGNFVRILSLIYLTVGCNLTCAAVYQGVGNTKPIMVTTFVKVGLNIILDYLLIFGNLGFPELGITGAAWATVIASSIANLLLFVLLMRSGVLPIHWRRILHPAGGIYRKVFSFGSKAGSEFMLWTGAQVVMIRMLNHFDQMGAGLFGILNTLLGLSVNLYLGIGVAATTLVGKATGATDHRSAFYIGNICVVWAVVLCVIVCIAYLFFPAALLHIFTNDTTVIERLVPLCAVVALVSLPKSVNVVIGNAIRGTGDARWMLMTQIAGTTIIILFSAYLLFGRHLGVAALVWANFADELWRAGVNYCRFYFVGRKKIVVVS